MRRIIRVLSDDNAPLPSSLIDGLKAGLKLESFELLRSDLSQLPAASTDSGVELLELLYVPAGRPLDRTLGARFASLTEAAEVGVYLEGLRASPDARGPVGSPAILCRS